MSDVIVVQGFDLALSQARQRQGGGVARRFWSIFGTATSPSRRERWPDLHTFVTADDGLAMSAAEFGAAIGFNAEVALSEMGTGDPRYWERRAALTELRAEWSAEGPVRREGAGRPVSSIPVNDGSKVQVHRNYRNARITHDDSAGAIMARLRRDDPAAADRVARGESTANFEAVQRGWRKPSITLGDPATVAGRLRERYSREELGLLIGALLAGDDAPGLADLWPGGDEDRLAAWARAQSIPWSSIADAAGLSDADAARYRYGRR